MSDDSPNAGTKQVSLSGRRDYPDDRDELAYAYNGQALVAVAYEPGIVEHWEEATDYDVVRTPRGEQYV